MELLVSILDAITTPLLIVGGLWLTVRHFKIVRTVSYIERFHHPNMVATRAAVDAWLQSPGQDDQRLQRAKSDQKLNAQIHLFVSFFTEVGIAYRHGTLDRDVAFDIWEYLVPHYWQKLEFFVKDRQAEVYETQYKSFGVLAGDMLGTGRN